MTDDEREVAVNEAGKAWSNEETQFEWNGHLLVAAAAYNVAIPMGWWGGAPAFMPPSTIVQAAAKSQIAEQTAQTDLLRDIFGNPFRALTADTSWLTSAVMELARGIYAERAFDRLPILADALQDAGCVEERLLDHCRSPGPHVRGCWGLDLVLGLR